MDECAGGLAPRRGRGPRRRRLRPDAFNPYGRVVGGVVGVDLAGECRMSAGVLPTGDLEAVCSLRNKRYIRDSSKSATGTREWSDPRCSSHT